MVAIEGVLSPLRQAMKIVHLSTYDIKGGAALSAYRLHSGLSVIGHDSSMVVKYRSGQDPKVMEYVLPMNLSSRFQRRVRRNAIVKSLKPYVRTRPPGFELFSEDRTPYGDSVVQQVPACDVMNLHWVAAYVDYERFFPTASRRAPIVWTLHDMNAVTGGCHYDMECGSYRQQCGSCPQLGSREEHDLSRQVWERKKAVMSGIDPRRICIVTPSRWLGQVVANSSIFGRFRLEIIPYGINLEDFAPRDCASARDVLGIPQNAKVILFLAEAVDNRRKGFEFLAKALLGCERSVDRLWLLSVGNNAPRIEAGVQGSHLNYVGNDRFLSLAYSAADVFVIPSLQDNLPNTVLEAMACGVPVIGFDVGGVRDMVRHEKTGLLVKPGDIDGLRAAIVSLLTNGANNRSRSMGLYARQIALEEYPLVLQAQRYGDLYKDLVG
ncbi:glycosyl transferase family 1 [Nitrospira sp. KM1]|nr:glycosyl transferase family 1 [Nitrospira sp. KM1]